MKGPVVDIDIDALISGVTGGPEIPKKKKKSIWEGGDFSDSDHSDLEVDEDGKPMTAVQARQRARENTVDELLSEYAAEPKATKTIKKKKVN